MSRNFELLKRAEKEQELLGARVEAPPAVPANGGSRFSKAAPVREEEVNLVQRLFLSSPEAPRAVVFCGVEPGYGPEWICTRASEVLAAQVLEPVCVVDANFRAPRLHQYWGVDSSLGLTDALLDSGPIENFAVQTGKSNLWLVPCGSRASDPHILLRQDRLQARFADLRSRFDYILISTSPAHLSASTIALSQISDGVVLMLQAHASRREAALRVKLDLEAVKVKLLGAVLYNRTFPIP